MLKKSNKISLEEATRLAILGRLPLKESTTVTTTDDNLTVVETDDANIVIEPKDDATVDINNPVDQPCTEPECADIPVDNSVNEPVEDLPAVVPEDLPTEEATSDETIDEPIEESKVVEGKKIEEGEAPLFKKKINKTDIKKVESKDKGLKEHKVAFKSSNKLQEGVYAYEYIGTFNELYETSWGQAKRILDEIAEAGKEEELMDYLEEYGSDPENAIDRTSLNDLLAYDWEIVFEALGINEDEDEDEDLDESKKVESKLQEGEAPLFKKKINKTDIKKVESKKLTEDSYSEGIFADIEEALENAGLDVSRYTDDGMLTKNIGWTVSNENGKAYITCDGSYLEESKDAELFNKKINKTDIKKVESKEKVEEKEPKRHIINKVDLRKTESITVEKEAQKDTKEALKDIEDHLKTKVAEGLTKFVKEAYTNGKEVKVEKILKLTENKLYVKGSLVMENSTRDFSCKLIPVMENKSFRKYTIKENKLLKITEGKTSKGKEFNLIVKK